MRVLHLVTLVSDDGAFGGPLTVAVNQASELRRRGHDVVVAAGWRGMGDPPTALHGTPARLFPVMRAAPTGLTGFASPGLLHWLGRHVETFDLLHVHAGRDLVTLPGIGVARRAGLPYVMQTHGMITPDDRLLARVLDAAATRRYLRGARRVLVLTDAEEDGLRRLAPSARLTRVPNGIAVREVSGTHGPGRDVLFCARLHRRKRPLAFVDMAAGLADAYPDVSFSMVGPDEGELRAVTEAIARHSLEGRVRYEGALAPEQVEQRLARASVYVLPSVDEPFPMSLLEALSLGVPSVCTNSCGISPQLEQAGAALVSDPSVEALTAAVGGLLASPQSAKALGERGRAAAQQNFSIRVVGDLLEQIYEAARRDA